METVVLYTSHYGATKQYATALAAALGAPCFALGTEDAQAVRSAGRIVYGGGLYAGGKKAVPVCSYAVAWFEKHPEYADVLASK